MVEGACSVGAAGIVSSKEGMVCYKVGGRGEGRGGRNKGERRGGRGVKVSGSLGDVERKSGLKTRGKNDFTHF